MGRVEYGAENRSVGSQSSGTAMVQYSVRTIEAEGGLRGADRRREIPSRP